jgi:hypothetical protein
MKKIICNEHFLAIILFVIIICVTFLQSIHQDFTSIIDFDLTVIHNSLQLVSNKYPDYIDHTAYSHFLTYGIIYKLFSFFDQSLITNIDLLVKLRNPEIALQELYIISRIANSIIHFILIIFFYKLMGIFYIKKYYKVLSILFLIFSESFIANLTILRSDIVAICYFFISIYFLLGFIKKDKVVKLFFASFFMMLSLLAKVQIIFLFLFIFFFYIFYCFFEKKNICQNILFYHPFIQKNSKYFLLLFIFLYFAFQIALNHFVNSSTGVGYFDFFCFIIYFIAIFFSIKFITKKNHFIKEYLYSTFSIILIFFVLNIFLLYLFKIFGFIKIDFNIIFSITNPFYFLKTYSPFANKNLEFSLIYEMINLFFKNFNFNLIYTFLLIVTFLFCLFKIIFFKIEDQFLSKIIYILLLGSMTFFLVLINNFRSSVFYNLYAIPLLFLLIGILLNLINDKIRFSLSIILSSLLIVNFTIHFDKFHSYLHKPSNLSYVCVNKPTRDFYYHWARNFNEVFFSKICSNNNYKFK